jgi:DNA-directed RNA polymerase specialized sigma24 family protein
MTEDYSRLTDAELAVACSRRPPDKPAWNALLQRYRCVVEAKIRRMTTLPSAQVEELRQEIFLRIFLILPKYEVHSKLPALILGLTSRMVIDNWRHSKSERATTGAIEEDPGPAHEAADESRVPAHVIEKIGRIEADAFENPLHRTIAHLVLDETSGPKIQRQLGVSRNVVYGVRRKLQKGIRNSVENYRSMHGLKK